jgi:hypothetical protein
MRTLRLATAVAALALSAPAAALAADYPPSGNPGSGPKNPPGKGATLKVCKQKGCKYKTISSAVSKASGGDTIRVAAGTYKEGVKIVGSRYDGLRLVGDPRKPRSVIIELKGVKGSAAQNGVIINGADGVEVNGFYARHYRGNGFFAVNVDDYTFRNLVAGYGGVYGIYGYNSKGGEISNSEAFYNNDSGFYIGQTPLQTKPKRSIVKKVRSWGNVIGWSGTNMHYVTITKSDWYNNGLGIVPNALASEKYAPPSDNVIASNRIFWNNFNYYAGAPFKLRPQATGDTPYPVGTGMLLFGSQDTLVEKNRVYGNWLAGFGAVEQVLLAGETDPKLQEAAVLRSNTVRDNRFGLGGDDLNGRDMVYEGSGTRNCFAGNTTLSPNVPASNSTFASCPGPAQNAFDNSARATLLGWVAAPSKANPITFEQFWLTHPHGSQKGLKACTHYDKKKATAFSLC